MYSHLLDEYEELRSFGLNKIWLIRICHCTFINFHTISYSIHVWYIIIYYILSTHICHKHQPNGGKYTVHGSYGHWSSFWDKISFFLGGGNNVGWEIGTADPPSSNPTWQNAFRWPPFGELRPEKRTQSLWKFQSCPVFALKSTGFAMHVPLKHHREQVDYHCLKHPKGDVWKPHKKGQISKPADLWHGFKFQTPQGYMFFFSFSSIKARGTELPKRKLQENMKIPCLTLGGSWRNPFNHASSYVRPQGMVSLDINIIWLNFTIWKKSPDGVLLVLPANAQWNRMEWFETIRKLGKKTSCIM